MTPEPYDFRKPGPIAADTQGRLLGWFRAAFAQANKIWSKQLPLPLDAQLGAVEVRYAGAALAGLPEATVGYRIPVDGGRLPTLLVASRLMVLRLVAAMLGDNNPGMQDRELTLIEENLADYFLVNYWLPFFRDTWPKSKPVAWSLEQRDANPHASRLFVADDTLVALDWQLRGAWGEASAAWFFQKKGLFEALGEIDAFAPPPPVPEVVHRHRQEAVIRLPLCLEVTLGSADLKLSDISNLQVGDVVLLDRKTDDPIVARIGARAFFRGKLGRIGSSKALKIEAHEKR